MVQIVSDNLRINCGVLNFNHICAKILTGARESGLVTRLHLFWIYLNCDFSCQ